MAKFNKSNNNKRTRPSYFDKQIQQYGSEDFLKHKNPNELRRESRQIFQDLARGNINILKHGKYFCNDQLLKTLIDTAQVQYRNYGYRVRAFDALLASDAMAHQDENLRTVYANDKRKFEAYMCMYNGLCQFYYSGGNTQLLVILTGQLRDFSTEFYN